MGTPPSLEEPIFFALEGLPPAVRTWWAEMAATEVNILNVGAGACTVVRHGASGHITMVDVNDGTDQRSYEPTPTEAPLTDPIDWCKANYGNSIFRFILSHPDADHMAGLRRLIFWKELEVTNFWDLPHSRSRTEEDCKNREAWIDWLTYDSMRKGLELEDHEWPKVIQPLRDDQRDYWRDDGIHIWSPDKELVDGADQKDLYNDASYVLRFRQDKSSVLVAGDVEEPAWQDMLAVGELCHVKVLVASHHGRKSGFSQDAMDAMEPDVVVVSTAKLDAEHDGISDYKRCCDHVFSTRVDGNIRVHLEGADATVYDEDGNLLADV